MALDLQAAYIEAHRGRLPSVASIEWVGRAQREKYPGPSIEGRDLQFAAIDSITLLLYPVM